MKKLLVVILMILTCIGMSGIATSSLTPSNQKKINLSTIPPTTIQKTNTIEQLKKSMYNYLNLKENPYPSHQEYNQTITAPWIYQATNTFEWWIRIIYDGQTYQKQLNVSIKDFQKKFLQHQ